MAETDLSKIVNLIMENPKLIEEIKNLGAKESEKESEAVSVAPEEAPPQKEAEAPAAEATEASEEKGEA
jgi:hypothetical protein